jgi:serine/threonine protein kinase
MLATKGYKIEQTNNTDHFTLYIKGPSHLKDEIYKSIDDTDILSNVFYNDESETIIFTAETVVTLTSFVKKRSLTMLQAIKMINDLSKQIAHLEINGFAFYGYDLDDIIVINDTIFIIVNTSKLLDVVEDNIIFNSPIKLPYFSNPEVNKLTNLPSTINYRSSYYSLGALTLFCLLNVYIYSELDSYLDSELETQIDLILQPLYYTKMYWFLKRCLHKKSEQRLLLFI